MSKMDYRTRIVGEIEQPGGLGSHKLARTPVDLLDILLSRHYNGS